MKPVIFYLLILIPAHLIAQNNLKGIVHDSDGKPLDAVTITLSQNDKIINNQLSDNGHFSFSNLNTKTYQLTATCIGYKALTRTFTRPKDSLMVIMTSDRKTLKEVVITSAAPTVERKVDRVVFNVAGSIVASGGNVYDAMKRAPGVKATDDGSVTANNKSVTVYIDDRPVQLSGDDLVTYLQSMPAENISKIEVLTVPGAKYDAQGGAVINIVSKKNKGAGLNLNFGAGYILGRKSTYKGNTVFNYRKDKLNLYGAYSYQDRNTLGYGSSYDIYTTANSYSYWDKQRSNDQNSKSNNYNFGLDYNLTDNQIIGFLVTGNNSTGNFDVVAGTNVYNNHRIPADSALLTNGHKQSVINRYSFNFNYKVKLDTSGRSLNVDIDYVPFKNLNTQTLDNFAYLPDGGYASAPTRFLSPASQKIMIWSGKLDYDYKLGKKWIMESGLKYTGIVTENNLQFFTINGNKPIMDPLRSDIFRYTENTAAAYTSISAQLDKWSLKGGLRAEDTRTEGNSIALDSLHKNSYLRLFPTAYITYKASEDHVFQLNYSRRIDRPDYSQLNPARTYTSPYSYSNGNPFLQPSIDNYLEAAYVYKQNYTIQASFNQIENKVGDATIQDNVSKTYNDTQTNLGTIRDIGLQLLAVNHPFSWWEINSEVEGYYRRQTQLYLNGAYQRTFNYSGNLTNTITISKKEGFKAELTGWYNSAFHQGSLNFARTYDVSAGLSKTVLNNQGTIRFAAADLLYGNPFRININYLNQQNGVYLRSDTRNFTLSFSYKLGRNIAAARKRSTASEEEKSRAN